MIVAKSSIATALGAIALFGWAPTAHAATHRYVDRGTGTQLYRVPERVTRLEVTATGAPGLTRQADSPGGRPETVTGVLAVRPGQMLFLEIGTTATTTVYGYNGGAPAGGGGATDIRTVPPTLPGSVASRLLVAGGGGGGGQGDQAPALNGGAASQAGPGAGGTPPPLTSPQNPTSSDGSGATGGAEPGLDGAARSAGGGGGGLFGGGSGAVFVEPDPPGRVFAGRGGNGSSYAPPGGTRSAAPAGAVASMRITEIFPSPPDRTRPRLSRLGISPSSFRPGNYGKAVAARVGGRVSYRLSEAATTTFTVQRAVRKRGRTVYRRLRGSFARPGVAGRNRFTFTGRLRGRALVAGRYRLVAVSKDRAGNKAKPAHRAFRIR